MGSAQAAIQVANWDFETRLKSTFEYALPKLGPDAVQQLKQIISPESLGIMAGVLVAWVVSQGFGVGEIIDVVILVVGVLAIGMSIFTGIDHLYDAVIGTYKAKNENDLKRAGSQLAEAISILGVQAVLAIFFRRMPLAGRKVRYELGPEPRNARWRYKPTTNEVSEPAGTGVTSFWGNAEISRYGTDIDRALVRRHERIHQILAPKFYFMRNFRVQNRVNAYLRSSLWRYIEEALAETSAQVGVFGMRKFFTGIKFPVKLGYVYLTRSGGVDDADLLGRGVLKEAATLLNSGIIMGMSFKLWYSRKNIALKYRSAINSER